MESILTKIGECGKFQICHVTLVQTCRFVVAWAFSLMIFGLYNPGWRCVHSNSSGFNSAFEPLDMKASMDFSPKFNSSTTGTKMSLKDVFLKSENYTAEEAKSYNDAYNGTCDVIGSCEAIEFNSASSTIVSEFGLVCDKVWISHLIVSIQNIGMLIGSFVIGYIGERFGRKVGLYTCIFLTSVTCGLAVLSPNWEVYALFMFFIGLGAIPVPAVSAIMCMEFLNSKWRACIGSIPIWNLGIISFAAAVYILRDWRQIHLTCAFVCGVAGLGVLWTPESLRWLMLKGKNSRARKVVTKITRMNNKHVPTETLKTFLEKDEKGEEERKSTYLDLFRQLKIRYLIFKLCIIKFVSVYAYEVLSFGVKSLPGDFYMNIVLISIFSLPVALLTGPLANRIGRRMTGIVFLSIGTLSSITMILSLLVIQHGKVRDILITSMSFANVSAAQALITLMYTYVSELCATSIRNLTFGFLGIVGRVTGIIGPLLIPTSHSSMVLCISVLLASQLLATVAMSGLTETRNRALEDFILEVEETNGHETTDLQSKHRELKSDESSLS